MPKKKEVTNEALARMVQRGFESVDSRFEKVDKRFNSIDKRFEKINQEIAALKAGQGHLLNNMVEVKDKLDRLAPYYELKLLEKRIERLELKLNIKGT